MREEEANRFPFLRPRAADAENQRSFTSWLGPLGVAGASAAPRHPPGAKGSTPPPAAAPVTPQRALGCLPCRPQDLILEFQRPGDFHLLLPPGLVIMCLWLQRFVPSRKTPWSTCQRNVSRSPFWQHGRACADGGVREGRPEGFEETRGNLPSLSFDFHFFVVFGLFSSLYGPRSSLSLACPPARVHAGTGCILLYVCRRNRGNVRVTKRCSYLASDPL